MKYITLIFFVLVSIIACSPYDVDEELLKENLPRYEEGCSNTLKEHAKTTLFFVEALDMEECPCYADGKCIKLHNTFANNIFKNDLEAIIISKRLKIFPEKLSAHAMSMYQQWEAENKERVDRCTPLLIGEKASSLTIKTEVDSEKKQKEKDPFESKVSF